jgi:hypothetical protein
VLYPVVTREPSDPAERTELSQSDLDRLEATVGLTFNPDVRRALRNIAATWIAHDRLLQSPRPRDFRRRLRQMQTALQRVVTTLDLHGSDAPILDHHLLNWLINAPFDAARDMQQAAGSLITEAQQLIDAIHRVQRELPPDPGRARPMDEDRFIINLAEQFDASGVSVLTAPSSWTGSLTRNGNRTAMNPKPAPSISPRSSSPLPDQPVV